MGLGAEEQTTRFNIISKELIAVFLAIVLQSMAAIWWASDINTRVEFLEYQNNKGDRNTKAQGDVRDVKIEALITLVAECRSIHREQSDDIADIKEDLAIISGRRRNSTTYDFTPYGSTAAGEEKNGN